MMRILLADDHPIWLDGLRTILADLPDVEFLPSVGNGHQLLDCLHRTAVDLVLMDLNMPKMDGLTALKTIANEFPGLPILVFTSYSQPQYVREARALGARGYLLKTTDAPTLKAAVRAVADGKTWFPDGTIKAAEPPTDAFLQKHQLTKREVEIIRLIATGLTTKQISDVLFLSEFTINAHRRNINRKLDLDTPVALVNFAREEGLL